MKAEGSTLPNEHVYTILVLLENASLDEVVRGVLSEMSKIKDLFLIVIRSVEIAQNMKLISSLIQFVSNLCFGTGKFRKLLASEPPAEFMSMVATVLSQTEVPCMVEGKIDWEGEHKRVLLKQAAINFIGNLCCELKLRQHIASDLGSIFSKIFKMLAEDIKAMPFDWVESITKEMAVVINCSLEPVALNYISQNNVVPMVETVLKVCKIGEHRELISRCVNILAKVAKVEPSLD